MSKNEDGFEVGQELSFADILTMRGRKKNTPAETTKDSKLTREDIDQMDKDHVRELLDQHNTEHDGRTSVEDLRELLKKVVFVDL